MTGGMMARLPGEVIERIKTQVSLLRLVESQGYHPKKQGKDHVISCPFHDEKTPSLSISPKSNLFNCFGCCASGSVIDWVMKTRGISFRHAVEILQQGSPSLAAPTPNDKPAKLSRKQQLDVPFSIDAEVQTLLKQVINYYHETLLQSPEALAYLEKRGLGNRELIDQFKLGYANRTLGYRLPKRQSKTGKQLRDQLEAVGIYRESGHEHFKAPSWCRCLTPRVMWWKFTGAKCAMIYAKARLSTCIYPALMSVCGMHQP